MSKTDQLIDPNRAGLGKAVGRVPSGLFILTTRDAAGASALLVSWVQQVGFNPLAVCVALGRDRPARTVIEATGAFALSILAQSDSALLKRYARGVAPGVDPFDGVATLSTPQGQTVLGESLAWLDCRLVRVCETGGDHDLLIAEVVAGQILKEGPSFSHLRGSGLHY